jgi:hypothetical protein
MINPSATYTSKNAPVKRYEKNQVFNTVPAATLYRRLSGSTDNCSSQYKTNLSPYFI